MTKTIQLRPQNHRHLRRVGWDEIDKFFAPFYQQSVGFDRVFHSMEKHLESTSPGANNYPPYDIVQTTSDAYEITLAVAGFSADEIEVKLEQGVLTVRGEKAARDEERNYLHRGISTRKFRQRFHLADYVRVQRADLREGLLRIELALEIPEALKPRVIEVNSAG